METLYVIRICPERIGQMTARFPNVLESSQVIAGPGKYAQWIRRRFPSAEYLETGFPRQNECWQRVIDAALTGKSAAVIATCGAEAYHTACMLDEWTDPKAELEIDIVAGNAVGSETASAKCDLAMIALPDCPASWNRIEKCLKLALQADLCIAIHHPPDRKWQEWLAKICDFLLLRLSRNTACGIVNSHAFSKMQPLTLDSLCEQKAEWLSCIFVGNSCTKVDFSEERNVKRLN